MRDSRAGGIHAAGTSRRTLLVLLAVLALTISAATALRAGVQPGSTAQTDIGEFFFHGGPDDEAATLQSRAPEGCCFFDRDAPADGAQQAFQEASPVAADDVPADRRAAYWTGDFSGTLDTRIQLESYVSTVNPTSTLIGADVVVTVFADPELDGSEQPDKVIGRKQVSMTVGPTPTKNLNTIPVKGTVDSRLLIQVVPFFTDTGQDLRFNYDTPDTPAGFRDAPPINAPAPGRNDLPAADPGGLDFTAAVPVDDQRDEAEPIIQVDKAGNIYSCGIVGTPAFDFASVMTGDTDPDQEGNQPADHFHLLGEPPIGIQAFGAGGDCRIALAPEQNGDGFYNYSYAGLQPLTNFSLATSSDAGRTLVPNEIAGATIPGVDRQWGTFVDEDSVLLSYNQQAPRQIVVQRSDDGGLVYGPRVPASTTSPSFPGPMESLPAQFNPTDNDVRVAYFPWNKGTQINLSVSFDGGNSWNVCNVAQSPGVPGLFVTADHDREGNLYVGWAERDSFHTLLSTLPQERLEDCDQPVAEGSSFSITRNPGFSQPVQVDRQGVATTVFSWLTAGGDTGEPGRVAVASYGTATDGDPNQGSFRASWDVYLHQSLNALSDDPDFSQVRATTHPHHFDSICLLGLGCDVSGGDRTMADFFAADYNPATGEVVVSFNRSNKMPDAANGPLPVNLFLRQTAGPSLGGGTVDGGDDPDVVRTSTTDHSGDAIADYSSQGDSGRRTPQPAADVTDVEIGPERNLETDEVVTEEGGFSVSMQITDLSTTALTQTLAETGSKSLLWIFRFTDGFRSSAASARWNPIDGFTFGYNEFTAAGRESGGCLGGCVVYPGGNQIQGEVDRDQDPQTPDTITLSVPRAVLSALEPAPEAEQGAYGPEQRPQEVAADDGARFYDAAVFTKGNVQSPNQDNQGYLYPLDGTRGMDFLLPTADETQGDASPAVSVTDVAAMEGDQGTTPFDFEVTLSSESEQPVTVDYRTADGSTTAGGGPSATAGEDYTANSGTLTFAPGETAKTVTVEVAADTEEEDTEDFRFLLENPEGARPGKTEGIGTIVDDDTPEQAARGQGPDEACSSAFVPDSGFGDIADSLHEANIECIAWYEITQGETDDRYAPEQSITRAQMASFIAHLAAEGGIDLPDNPSDAFDDDRDSIHETNINALAEIGLVDGKGDTDGDGNEEYRPGEPVSRAQMASFIARVHREATGALPGDPDNAFDDDDASVHHDAINALAELGVVQGRQDNDDADGDGDTDENAYFPADDVSRAQMASFIAGDLFLYVDAGDAFPGGAEVLLDDRSGGPGDDLPGRLRTNKQPLSLTANGCGLDGERLQVGDDGSFTVQVPEGQDEGECELTLSAETRRSDDTGDGQVVPYTFQITVEG